MNDLIITLITVALIILFLFGWISMLRRQLKHKQYVWFIFTLIGHVIAMTIYYAKYYAWNYEE